MKISEIWFLVDLIGGALCIIIPLAMLLIWYIKLCREERKWKKRKNKDRK